MPSMNYSKVREKIIEAGVKNVKDFGYVDVDKETILTDYMYGKLFLNMLNDDENKTMVYTIEKVRLDLIKEVEANVRSAA